MRQTLEEWNRINRKTPTTNNNQILGLFSRYFNSPTQLFNSRNFYDTLRGAIIPLIIRGVLMNKISPNYTTGKEFLLYIKGILATVDIHDYNALDTIAIENLKKYLDDNKIKSFEIFGIYSNRLEINQFKNVEELEKFLNTNLEDLRTSNISNVKLNIEENLNIDIISSNLRKGKIENINHKNMIINIDIVENKLSDNLKNKSNSYKLIIKGIKEKGLLLLIPSDYKDEFKIDHLRKILFSLWKKISENLGLPPHEINKYFEKFISEIVKRRIENIKKWLENLTSSFNDERIKSLKEINYDLDEKWKICKEKCDFCYLTCIELLGHSGEHNCGYDHKCHEKCQICEITGCRLNNCDHICTMPTGHPHRDDLPEKILHSCSSFHKCEKKVQCQYKNLAGCTKECQLGFNHKEEQCFCKSRHICGQYCCYKGISTGCRTYCIKELNHEPPHLCKGEKHACIRECSLKNKSKGCINRGKCGLLLPHEECLCKKDIIHYCIEPCFLKGKSRNCHEECCKIYGHEGEHVCGILEKHACDENCIYKGKSKGCKEKCHYCYGHQKSF